MSKQIINIGTQANDRSGDPLRISFGKINSNFTELYDHNNLSNLEFINKTISSFDNLTLSVGDYNWQFLNDGSLSVPGILKNSTSGQTYFGSTVELNVQVSINKIGPTIGNSISDYHLSDGIEGQIMHIVANSSIANNEQTTMSIDNARWKNSDTIHELNVDSWLPFQGNSTLVTLAFTDGYWNLPHSNFAI